MNCPKCEATDQTQKFCTECGEELLAASSETVDGHQTHPSSPANGGNPSIPCPRCGKDIAGNDRFCRYCAVDVQARWRLSTPRVSPRMTLGQFLKLRKRVLAVGVAVVLVFAVAGISYAVGRDQNTRDRPAATEPRNYEGETEAEALSQALQHCLDIWNDETNGPTRTLLASATLGESLPYVSIGYAANYPDRCLVTASNPSFGARALQFLEDGSYGATFRTLSTDVPLASLDEFTKAWNASSDTQGYLSLSVAP